MCVKNYHTHIGDFSVINVISIIYNGNDMRMIFIYIYVVLDGLEISKIFYYTNKLPFKK